MKSGKRSTINWCESELLIKHKSPEEPVSPDGVAAYLDEVGAYARAVLHDLGIEEPVIPLPIDTRSKMHDREYFEESADATVAVRLLENVTFLKSLLDNDPLTRNQVNCMLWMMAQISALTSMPHLNTAILKRAKRNKQRSDRARNKEIRQLRAEGAKISVLEKIYAPVKDKSGKVIKPGLGKRQIQKILNEK